MEKDITTETQDILHEEEVKPVDDMQANGNKEKLLASMMEEDDEKIENNGHEALQALLHEISIDGKWFKRQIGFFFLLLIGVILYITNRYQAQQEMIREEELRKELKDWKFRNMTRTSELTNRTRQSQIELQLKTMGDSTLIPSETPPYTCIIEK
ncbi:MAG: hypothetical protein J6R98_07275 [Bacteroidaceae bacterium]|nr:hypothetical protein [Bacteroidaceae bacterium]